MICSNASPPLPRFEVAANELRRQEFARLADALPLRLEALRALTPAAFRAEIALMAERFGYEIAGDPSAVDLVIIRAGDKRIVACSSPGDVAPVSMQALARLHDAIITANAASGFYATARSFTEGAEDYAASAPIRLIGGRLLARLMRRSKAGKTLPETYRAMCRLCGDVVRHRLDQTDALPCANGHLVAPTIARATLLPRREKPAAEHAASRQPGAKPRPRNMSAKAQRRRAIKAHNHQLRARAVRTQHGAE